MSTKRTLIRCIRSKAPPLAPDLAIDSAAEEGATTGETFLPGEPLRVVYQAQDCRLEPFIRELNSPHLPIC
jgi:hypothetical protein